MAKKDELPGKRIHDKYIKFLMEHLSWTRKFNPKKLKQLIKQYLEDELGFYETRITVKKEKTTFKIDVWIKRSPTGSFNLWEFSANKKTTKFKQL